MSVLRTAVLTTALALAVGVPTAASARVEPSASAATVDAATTVDATAATAATAAGAAAARRCAAQFDRAVHRYVDTTRRKDAPGFNALLDRDVTTIFANGGVLHGRTQTADFITGFFADDGWTQTFTELTRSVEGCRSGFVLFDSVYSVPAQQRVSPLVIGVTFTYRDGRWLVLHNQDSTGPAST